MISTIIMVGEQKALQCEYVVTGIYLVPNTICKRSIATRNLSKRCCTPITRVCQKVTVYLMYSLSSQLRDIQSQTEGVIPNYFTLWREPSAARAIWHRTTMMVEVIHSSHPRTVLASVVRPNYPLPLRGEETYRGKLAAHSDPCPEDG